MNRALLLLPLAALATGCYVAPSQPLRNDVTFYWTFERFVVSANAVGYDTDPRPGGVSRGCAQSAVETIDVTSVGGQVIASAIPCIFEGVQGVTVSGFEAGTHRVRLTGYRGNTAVHDTTVDITVVNHGANEFAVVLPGIPDDLDIFADFFNDAGTAIAWTSCTNAPGGANVQTLAYELRDHLGTLVAQGTTACTDPAGLALVGSVAPDRDTYSIRLRALRTGVPDPILDSRTTRLAPTCSDPHFGHFQASTGAGGWAVSLYDVTGNPTLCQ